MQIRRSWNLLRRFHNRFHERNPIKKRSHVVSGMSIGSLLKRGLIIAHWFNESSCSSANGSSEDTLDFMPGLARAKQGSWEAESLLIDSVRNNAKLSREMPPDSLARSCLWKPSSQELETWPKNPLKHSILENFWSSLRIQKATGVLMEQKSAVPTCSTLVPGPTWGAREPRWKEKKA